MKTTKILLLLFVLIAMTAAGCKEKVIDNKNLTLSGIEIQINKKHNKVLIKDRKNETGELIKYVGVMVDKDAKRLESLTCGEFLKEYKGTYGVIKLSVPNKGVIPDIKIKTEKKIDRIFIYPIEKYKGTNYAIAADLFPVRSGNNTIPIKNKHISQIRIAIQNKTGQVLTGVIITSDSEIPTIEPKESIKGITVAKKEDGGRDYTVTFKKNIPDGSKKHFYIQPVNVLEKIEIVPLVADNFVLYTEEVEEVEEAEPEATSEAESEVEQQEER